MKAKFTDQKLLKQPIKLEWSQIPQMKHFERKNVRASIQPNIGLETGIRLSVIEMLNLLLADETVLSFKTQHAKSRPSGEEGSDFQLLYSSHYKKIRTISQKIRERIQILGGMQIFNTEKLISSARLDGKPNGLYNIINILADHEAFIRFLRDDAQKCSEIFDDQGTYAMLISILRVHEKIAWILRSKISQEAV